MPLYSQQDLYYLNSSLINWQFFKYIKICIFLLNPIKLLGFKQQIVFILSTIGFFETDYKSLGDTPASCRVPTPSLRPLFPSHHTTTELPNLHKQLNYGEKHIKSNKRNLGILAIFKLLCITFRPFFKIWPHQQRPDCSLDLLVIDQFAYRIII